MLTSLSVATDKLAMQDIPSQCGKDPGAFDNPGWDTGSKTTFVLLTRHACRFAIELVVCLCIHHTSLLFRKHTCKLA